MENDIEPGLYLHFKGRHYRMLGWVLDTEAGEHKVLYQSEDGFYYSRCIESWLSPAYDSAGNQVERFRRVGN